MGNSKWSDDAYKIFVSNTSTKSTDEIFTNNSKKEVDRDMSPKGLIYRECRDSESHPTTYPVMVFLDVTGSMGRIPETLIRNTLGTLMNTIIAHGINDAQICFGAIGDHIADKHPLQIGQFESGTDELIRWLSSIYLEGGGGGGNHESYLLAWNVGARHTILDSYEKRNQKGILITVGDERSWDHIDGDIVSSIFGYSQPEAIVDKDILESCRSMYDVYHIHVNQGSYKNDNLVDDYWRNLLGDNFIVMQDYNDLAEIIASLVALHRGHELSTIVSKFDSSKSDAIMTALTHITPATIIERTNLDSDSGIITL